MKKTRLKKKTEFYTRPLLLLYYNVHLISPRLVEGGIVRKLIYSYIRPLNVLLYRQASVFPSELNPLNLNHTSGVLAVAATCLVLSAAVFALERAAGNVAREMRDRRLPPPREEGRQEDDYYYVERVWE